MQKRICDQRKWYEKKARSNKRSAKIWMGLGVIAYAVGFSFIVVRIADPAMPGWPTEPLIVIAASLIGWTQIKKFNELASAYTLTAHEIGLTADLITDANSDEAFSSAVNEAELAFSRERTQWVARQNN
ncbi:SLATT domain-containing protein [Mesorhizobium sp. NZP2234]|uniref:SLATT domain-containing protein n=1 Tax=Mesorhizobium sp. NZP2234 TaxID=2483402 RepID=UPI001598E952|nr:SLATT domain-containing protein [Mesorhizobium sp. NZP2234]